MNHITPKIEEDSREAVMKTAKVPNKISKIHSGATYEWWSLTATNDVNTSILRPINEVLTKIRAQNRRVIADYKEPNMNTLEERMNRLSYEMQNSI